MFSVYTQCFQFTTCWRVQNLQGKGPVRSVIEYFWVCSIFENADILKFLFWWLLQSLKVLRMAFVTKHTTRVVENNYYVVTRKEMGKRAKLLLSLYLLGAFVSRTLYVVIAFGCSSCCQHDEWEFSNPESKPGKHSHVRGRKRGSHFQTSFFFKALKKQNSEETRPRGAVVLEWLKNRIYFSKDLFTKSLQKNNTVATWNYL